METLTKAKNLELNLIYDEGIKNPVNSDPNRIK